MIFEKYPNFRDLGGVANRYGAQVVQGALFRSEFPENIDEHNKNKLIELGIEKWVDLRTKEEFQLLGTNEYPDAVEYIHLPINSGNIAKELIPIFVEGNLSKLDPEIMPKVYLAIVKENTAELERMMNLVQESSGGVVFHCSHGKDRTGVISALLLDLLDVDREIIFQDYLRSNELGMPKISKQIQMIKGGFAAKFGRDLDDGEELLIKKLFYCNTDYLEVVFDFIEKDFGSTRNYFNRLLNFNDEKIENLRSRLLV